MRVTPEQLALASAGNLEAFDQIVAAYQSTISQVLTRLAAPEGAAAVTKLVFLRLRSSLGQLDTQMFESHLYRLTVNSAYAYRCRQRL